MSETMTFPILTGEPRPAPAERGAETFVRCLEQHGVDTVFAYPGGASMGLHQALLRSTSIRTILPRHEQGGVFAAEGYARATGRAGVCMATSGPGATNLVTGIADAYMDSIPLVVVTGQVARSMLGKRAFQEIDVLSVTRSISKWQYQLTDASEVEGVVAEAMRAAQTGRPGPVVIDFPKDVQQARVTRTGPLFSARFATNQPRAPEAIDPHDVERILACIERSERPVLYVGGGMISAGASAALRAFAHQTGIPVTTTLLGCGSFPETDSLSLRWLGMHGAAYANWAVDQADLLLAFGVRFDDRVTGRVDKFCEHGFIVHVDIDPSEIGRIKPAHLGLAADLRLLLPALSERLRSRPLRSDFGPWRERIASFKKRAPFRYDDDPETLAPQFIVEKLYELTRGQAILTTGVGQHQMWAAQFYQFDSPRRLLTSGGLGAMGFGLPAAIGAKVAFPEREVIDIDGDGSFLMNVQELATAKVEGIAVKAIIVDNQRLGMVEQWEDHYFAGVHAHTYLGDPSVRDQPYPDFVKMVESFGVRCERVTRRNEVEPALRRMLAAREPYVLDVITPYRAEVLPFIPAGGTVADMIY